MLCLSSIDGNSLLHSWDPTAVSGPITKSNRIYFFEQSSIIFILTSLNQRSMRHLSHTK